MSDQTEQDGGSGGIKALVDVAIAGMKGSNQYLRTFLALIAIVGILSLSLTGWLVFTKQPVLAVVAFVCALVAIVVLWMATRMVDASAWPGNAERPSGSDTWSRLIPRQPLPDEKQQELHALLLDARMHVHEQIISTPEGKAVGMELGDLRAHLMLAEYHTPPRGLACLLSMTESLQINMSSYLDKDLEFHPNQGISGYVFAIGESRVARVTDHPEDDETPIDKYNILTLQRRKIPPDLQWIVAVPLKRARETGGFDPPLAVLSVHGLKPLSRDLLKSVPYALIEVALATTAILAEDVVRITTRWEEQG